ncbi:peptidoglycan-binding domain-containing protein [Streptomyces sp. NPDC002133]|uniref:peptidoglycan-binding domain-containing protein n=1 Tax=Streptomyces sp. NPDC002133 TaxID=3154409 RepID=UPI0033231E7F
MRIKLGACTVGALTAALLVVSTTPAAASGTYSGRAYVYGGGVFEGDWDDEGIVSRSTHASSNATCMWQKILWADGFLDSTSDIDGVFGTETYNATRAWQEYENQYGAGLVVDGSAGKATFGRAHEYFDTANGKFLGLLRNFDMKRDADGNYQFVDGDGSWRKAGYDYRSCS